MQLSRIFASLITMHIEFDTRGDYPPPLFGKRLANNAIPPAGHEALTVAEFPRFPRFVELYHKSNTIASSSTV